MKLGSSKVAAGFCLAAPLVLTGCQTTNVLFAGGSNATSPELIAALDGGLIGQVADLEISQGDQRQALASEYRALEYAAPGESVTWKSSAGVFAGFVSASQPYRVGSQDCRQYTLRIFNAQAASNQTPRASARGTACRNANGSWSLLS
ncbi:MAG: hypothetical protein AAFY99_11175 [Pseudomonadota bacterium]